MERDTLRMPDGGEIGIGSDAERVVGIDQIFFSTTDDKGRITGANKTFSLLSRYPLQELLNAPHSIIRHQDMPGGVFQIMWDRLGEGKPVAAYVKNRANDGRLYWVFATVTPIPGGYLSVRTRPVFEPLWNAADSLYKIARPLELAAGEAGARRPEMAQVGLTSLAEGLASAGFEDYEAFMMEALPAEVSLRHQLTESTVVNAQPGTALGAVVGGAQLLDQRIQNLLVLITSLGELSSQMTQVLKGNQQTRELLRSSAERASIGAHQPGVAVALARSAAAFEEWVNRACSSLDSLDRKLLPIGKVVSSARFGIALTRLHNEMVLCFADEVSNPKSNVQLSEVFGNSGANSKALSIEFVPLLCQTIVGDINRLTGDLGALREALNQSVDYIEEGLASLQKTREFIASWQLMVGRYGDESLEDAVEDIAISQSGVQDNMIDLAAVASRCVEVFSQVDPAGVLEPIPVIESGAQELIAASGLEAAHV